MRCGAKCFLVEIEGQNGELTMKRVHARTPAGARKIVRTSCGNDTHIITVKEQKSRRI